MEGISDIRYVRFRIADLDRQEKFLADFGLAVEVHNGVLLARGTDPSSYVYIAEAGKSDEPDAFLGLGFDARSQQELERIAAIDGVAIEEIDLPGGGLRARLSDPDGNAVDIVWGIDRPEPLDVPKRQPLNFAEDQQRLGERVSLSNNSVIVKRLGHCVINVNDFRTSEAWYKQRIGFITSDEIYFGADKKTLGAFMRVNRGEDYVDHHTMFLVGAGNSEFNHAAFEVADWDTLMQGHDRLRIQAYEHRWGVGKHKLGSQVFDYWKDPSNFTMEHFTDGDLVNESFGSHKAPIEELLAVHWGPDGSP